jgi:hypothetical protein
MYLIGLTTGLNGKISEKVKVKILSNYCNCITKFLLELQVPNS